MDPRLMVFKILNLEKKKDKFPTEFSKPIIFNANVQRSGDYA